MKLTYQDPSKENWFLVSWTLSNKCNYRCSYCPEHLHSGSTGQPQWETVERFVKNFNVPEKEICYRLSGGEPTYWKHFKDLAKLVKEQGHTFTFLTNGSQSVSYYSEISNYSDGFIISYHPEYADKEHIIDVINHSNCPVFVNLMLSPDNFDKMYAVAEEFYTACPGVSIWPKVILDKSNIDSISNKVADYTEQQMEIIRNWHFFRDLPDTNLHRGELLLDEQPVTANDLITKEQNKFYGWKCWGGLHMINIDMWGNIYRADCKEGGALGNIERYKLPTETVQCGKQVCACLSDIYLRKETF